MNSKELQPSIDCAAYDPGRSFLMGLDKPTEQGKEDDGLLEAGYCFHPKLVKPGDNGAFCVIFYGNESCPLQVPDSSLEAQNLRDEIEKARKAGEPKTLDEVF